MEWFAQLFDTIGWAHWVILGVILGIVEILTFSFLALPFALAALVTALLAFFDLPITAQLLCFGITSVIMLFVIQRVVRTYFTSEAGAKIKTNYEALVAKQARVMDPIEGSITRGSVKVGGEIWSAITAEGLRLEKDAIVWVSEVSGATLTVTAEKPQEKQPEE